MRGYLRVARGNTEAVAFARQGIAAKNAQGSVLNQPFFAKGNIATAGGCLASQYLAGWIITRLAGVEAAERALQYVAPVGEKEEYVSRAMGHILRYVHNDVETPAAAATA